MRHLYIARLYRKRLGTLLSEELKVIRTYAEEIPQPPFWGASSDLGFGHESA